MYLRIEKFFAKKMLFIVISEFIHYRSQMKYIKIRQSMIKIGFYTGSGTEFVTFFVLYTS